ncbi:MAG: phenylacetate--CoA ligase, partial [Bacteroidetes bacterium]|nr:phenylacetate--CoA ligase [Bacteroidota bacterium]
MSQSLKNNKNFWDAQISTASRDKIAAVQLENLKKTLWHCYNNNSFYKKRIDETGLNPDKLKDLRDIEKLPFTSKDDLRENYPFGLFCTPLAEVIRVHASSGTTGNPTVVGYTREDLEIWADVLIRAMYDVGVRKEDIV